MTRRFLFVSLAALAAALCFAPGSASAKSGAKAPVQAASCCYPGSPCCVSGAACCQ